MDLRIPISLTLLVTVTIKVLMILKDATSTIRVKMTNMANFSKAKAAKKLALLSIQVLTK